MSGPVLGIIPARGGSKGVPRKNILPLVGRPLLAYTADAANLSGLFDRLILSTDSEEIARVGRELGLEVPFMRPADLAADDTPMLVVIQHALTALKAECFVPEIIVLLQPTSPLRTPEHIRTAIAELRARPVDSVASVVAVPQIFSPYYVMKIEDGRLLNFLPEGKTLTRRQDAPPAYWRDGTVYAFWRKTLEEQGSIYGERCWPLLLSAEEAITVDTHQDWQEAEERLRRQLLK